MCELCIRKTSPAAAKNLLDCLPDAMVLFQQITRWLIPRWGQGLISRRCRVYRKHQLLLVCLEHTNKSSPGSSSLWSWQWSSQQAHFQFDTRALHSWGGPQSKAGLFLPLLCPSFLNILYPPTATSQSCATPHKVSVTTETLQLCPLVAQALCIISTQTPHCCLYNARKNGMVSNMLYPGT